MPKAMHKTLLKLGIVGFASLLLFNYPLLSLYRGYAGDWPVLYVLLFVLWLVVILIARRITEPYATGMFKAKPDQDAS
ncbi:MAG: hypothetical protein ACKN9C_05255 [Fluviibacter sp.]